MYSRYVLVKKVLFSNFLRLRFPYKLTFALTYRCNLKCKTCFIWKKEKKAELSVDEIEVFFKRSNGFSWLDLSGGEVFLRDDLPEISRIIFSYCRRLCLLHFATNGQLPEATVNIIKQILKYRRKTALVITISMDGPEGIHNDLRGSNDAWGKALDTFMELKSLGLKFVYLGYTLSRFNAGYLEDMVKEIGDHYPAIAHTSEHFFGNAAMQFMPDELPLEELSNFHKTQDTPIKAFLEKHYLGLMPRYLSSGLMPLKCQALSSTCFADPYGDIYPCTIYNRKIGNIRDVDYDLSGLWNKDSADICRRDILNKKCTGCWTPCEAYPAILGSALKMIRLGQYNQEAFFNKGLYCHEQ